MKTEIENIPAEELNVLVCWFSIEIPQNGKGYELASLASLQRSLQRYLNDKNTKLNIMKDQGVFKVKGSPLSQKTSTCRGKWKMKSSTSFLRIDCCGRGFIVYVWQVWWPQPRSSSKNCLVAPLPSLWIPCTRWKQKIEVGRHCALNRQWNL